ncbi:MAG: ATP-binding cassette domain-containing protein [Bacteroidales bacterium]|nr:MAG: ATP-binding cassette domain-containing protein [Bacteroidales bacterium]
MRLSRILDVVNVSAGYGSEVILKDINFEVVDNDFIGVIGPNGGGKTTLLKLLLGEIKPFQGRVNFYPSSKDETLFGYLPQVSSIDREFPIKVMDIVLSGLMNRNGLIGGSGKQNRTKAIDILTIAGVDHLWNSSVGELSGGQLQRVFLCRALISQPRLLILDEPNTFVDNKFEKELYELLRELNRRMAIIMVSHDVGTITSYVKTIACVNRHLHYHRSNRITPEQLAAYECPIQIISHGKIPHTVLLNHNKEGQA